MTIYQINKHSEYGNHIVGTYLKKEKAEEEKERLEKINAMHEKCSLCVLEFCEDNCEGNCEECCKPENQILKAKKYCDRFELERIQEDYVYCKNKVVLSDGITYEIEEVEVVE